MSRTLALPRDLLDRPADEAARWLALDELARAERARIELARGENPEALHDFRVGLRRLRSHLRAFRAELEDAAGRKARRRLGALADSTNVGRDAEVGLALLAEVAATAEGAERRAIDALSARLAERRDRSYRGTRERLLADFERLAGRLRERLSTWRVEVRLEGDEQPPRRFRAALGDELARHADALLGALESVGGAADSESIHRARIEAKRLRYLLEPVASRLAAAAEPVQRLRDLQDLLGRANDLSVLAGELAGEAGDTEREFIEAAASGARSRRPGGRSGRAALARRLAAERAEIWRRFDHDWLGPAAAESERLSAGIAALVDELAEPVAAEAGGG